MAGKFECYASQDTIPFVSRIIALGKLLCPARILMQSQYTIPFVSSIYIFCFKLFLNFIFDLQHGM